MDSVVIFASNDFRKQAQALSTSSALTRTSSHTDHCSVKPSLRRNHPHRRTTIAISPGPELRRSASIAISRLTLRAIAIAPIGVDRDHRNQRDCDRDLADLARSVDRRFAQSRSRRSRSRRSRSRSLRSRSRSRSHRENMLSFWVLFEFLGMNDIMCLFGS